MAAICTESTDTEYSDEIKRSFLKRVHLSQLSNSVKPLSPRATLMKLGMAKTTAESKKSSVRKSATYGYSTCEKKHWSNHSSHSAVYGACPTIDGRCEINTFISNLNLN